MDHQSIISDLGGIRALARKLGHAQHTTVQGWYDRNRIPLDRWAEVIGAAEKEGKPLSSADLMPPELSNPNPQAA